MLHQIMKQKNIVVIGDTLDEKKVAYDIKQSLITAGYNIECVGSELESINDVYMPIDVLDLCINPIKGLKLLQEATKPYHYVLIQPGAESEDIIDFLKENDIPHIKGCALVGLKLYPGEITK